MDQSEYVQIELGEAIASEHLIQASDKNWDRAWLLSPIKYRILYKKVQPFIINLPASYSEEKGFRFYFINLQSSQEVYT